LFWVKAVKLNSIGRINEKGYFIAVINFSKRNILGVVECTHTKIGGF
jgi:uncharacterized membrane protein YiaA